MSSELPLEVRQELTRLRAIMYEPSAVWLGTWAGERRWLTDGYVMLDVTDSAALEDEYIADGGYKLVASKGFESRDTIPEPDLDVYFARMDELADWHPVKPSEWSVAEHPGKAMLWVAKPGDYPFPCLLGEPTWTAIKRNHPDCLVEYSEETNVFRFSEVQHDGCEPEAYCGCRPMPFCFAAGIRVPEGQDDVAHAIAQTVDTTSNEES
jgi:hypothetical protein